MRYTHYLLGLFIIFLPVSACASSNQTAPQSLLTFDRKQLEAAKRYNQTHDGVSLLIIHRGEILVEDYPNGGAADKAWNLASGTKSFSGIIAAAMVQDGLLSMDEKVSNTITEWQEDDRRDITVRQLLTLTSGIKTPRPSLLKRTKTYKEAIASPLLYEPGSRFAYGQNPFLVFGELVSRKTKPLGFADPLDYLNQRVFEPMGLEPDKWRRLRDGNPTMAAGAQLSARNWALFGKFLLQEGAWEGEQLVDRQTLLSLTKGTAANPGYGTGFWVNGDISKASLEQGSVTLNATDFYSDPRYMQIPADFYMAAGAGNQRLYLIPSMELVIVRQSKLRFRQGGKKPRPRFSDIEFLSLLLDL